MSSTRRLALVAVLLSATFTLPAHAVSKEMIQLQTQVQQLQDAVARLQQSNDERMGVLKDLVQQTADSVNRMSMTVGTLQQHEGTQQDAAAAKADQLSGQIQSLNDSLDELKARFAKVERALSDIQGQQQTANAILQNLPAGGGAGAAVTQPVGAPPQGGDNPGGLATQPAPLAANAPAGPGVDALYRNALSDYMAGKYPLAASEFADVVKQFPDENLSGNAYFYLGEINMRSTKPSIAVKDYDHLLEHYPDNSKIPAAHLHKADALLAMKQNEAGVVELRALIQRFPNSPEAVQARSKLNAMGVPIHPRR